MRATRDLPGVKTLLIAMKMLARFSNHPQESIHMWRFESRQHIFFLSLTYQFFIDSYISGMVHDTGFTDVLQSCAAHGIAMEAGSLGAAGANNG